MTEPLKLRERPPPPGEIGILRFLGNNSVAVHEVGDAVELRFGRGFMTSKATFSATHAAQIADWLSIAAVNITKRQQPPKPMGSDDQGR